MMRWLCVHDRIGGLNGPYGFKVSASPNEMMQGKFSPWGSNWSRQFKPVTTAQFENAAQYIDFDVTAAQNKYIPEIVRELLLDIESRDGAVEVVTRLNLRDRLSSLIQEATARAHARMPDFNVYLAIGDIDD